MRNACVRSLPVLLGVWLATTPSLATISSDDLPTYSGHTWTMEVTNTEATGAEGPYALIITIAGDEFLVFRYNVTTKDEVLLYSGDVDTITADYEWTLKLPEADVNAPA